MEEWTQFINHYFELNQKARNLRPSYGHIIRCFYIELESFFKKVRKLNDSNKIYSNSDANQYNAKVFADLITEDFTSENNISNN
ncbi:MAG: hypothetical protein K9J13_10040 [Saprospiraceae bacterium]|nr:hypothetical protein [Saprospiraceae bacterium]